MVQTAMVGMPCKIRLHSSLNFQFFFSYNLKADVLPLPIITVMIRSLCWSLELMVSVALCSILPSCAVQYHFMILSCCSLDLQVVDKHLSILAKQHVETRFVKVHAEKAPFLTEKLRIVVLPTLAIVKNAKVEDYVVSEHSC